jgi:hypothetical protein
MPSLPFRRPLSAALFLTILDAPFLASAWAGEDSLPPKTLAAVKAATVFIKVEVGRESGSGSGFVIKTEGQTAYLVTNNHVIDPSDGKLRVAAAVTAIFGSGTKNERSARAEVVAADARRDLAVLKVQGVRDLPEPIDFSHEPDLVETMPVFILGFPLGEMLAVGKASPAITVGKGSVSSIRLNERGDVATVQIAGDITPGNSGGPVVDGQGRLVGIAVATIRNRAIGFAIPMTALTRLLNGRLLDYHFTARPAGPGQLEVRVELGVFDPFERIQGITFYYLDRDNAGAKKLASVAGVRKVDLRRSQRQIAGTFTLAGCDGAETPVAFQAVYVNGEGKTFLSNPRVRRFRLGGAVARPPAIPPASPPGRPPAPPLFGNQPLDKEGVKQALADLGAEDVNRRRVAAERLQKTPPEEQRAEVIKALEPLLTEKDLFVRTNGVKAYIVWAGKDGVPQLYKLLQCKCFITRGLAIEAVARFEGAKAAEAIAACLPDLAVRRPASKALQGIGPKAEKAVQPYLEQGDFLTRVEACKLLQAIGTDDSLAALERASNDKLPGVAPAARAAMDEIRKRTAGGVK